MNTLSRALAMVLLVPVVVTLIRTDLRAADEESKQAHAAILDVAKKLMDNKDVSKDTAEIKKKFEDLNTLMYAYKPSPKGGIGTGLQPKAGDGIEMKIIALGRRALPPATLSKEKDVITKIGYVNAALAEITMQYAPTRPRGGKGAKEWNQYCKDMKDASMELVKAVKASDPKKVRAAANNLNNSCNNCHSDFRD